MFRGAQAIRVPRSLVGTLAQVASQRFASTTPQNVFHWSIMQKVITCPSYTHTCILTHMHAASASPPFQPGGGWGWGWGGGGRGESIHPKNEWPKGSLTPHAARTLEADPPGSHSSRRGRVGRRRDGEEGDRGGGAREICVTNCSYSALQVGYPVLRPLQGGCLGWHPSVRCTQARTGLPCGYYAVQL
jgi:hypothetical protein